MATEIERKFLVTGTAWRRANAVSYSQGYLNRDKGRTVRVRVAGDHGYLTIKGATTGASRAEFEYEIPLVDAAELLKMCDGPIIQKFRHLVDYKGFTWEVDEFLGDNAGLVVAEIELESEDQLFDRPEWVGDEVTDLPRYYNSNLAATPFCKWDSRNHPYKLRPGYGCDELLLEFDSLVDDRRFVDDLRHVLRQGGFVTTGTIEITYNSLLRFTSPFGVLDITGDEWGGVFGHGLYWQKQQAVLYADKLLRESELFEKVEVDFVDYLMPLEEKEQLCPSNKSSGGFMKTIILWLGFIVCFTFMMKLEGVYLRALIQPAPAFMIFGSLLLYLVHRNGRDLFGFIKRVIMGEIDNDDVKTIDRTCSLGLIFGGVSMTVGLIHVMSNLSNTAKLGSGVAIAFVSVIYAAVPSILLLPVMRHDATNGSKMTNIKQSAGYMLIAFLALTLCIFVVLYAMKA